MNDWEDINHQVSKGLKNLVSQHEIEKSFNDYKHAMMFVSPGDKEYKAEVAETVDSIRDAIINDLFD